MNIRKEAEFGPQGRYWEAFSARTTSDELLPEYCKALHQCGAYHCNAVTLCVHSLIQPTLAQSLFVC